MNRNNDLAAGIASKNHEWFRCPKCNYSLIGLPENICPECGSPFDPEFLQLDPELRRRGSPNYGMHGIRFISNTLLTLLLVMFRPVSFANRLRVDESIRPAFVVFAASTALYPTTIYGRLFGNPRPNLIFSYVHYASTLVAWVGILILALAFLLSISAAEGRSSQWTFRIRFRFWSMALMYSTVFMLLWPFVGADTRVLSWDAYITDWPLVRVWVADQAYYVTAFLFWWTTVISVSLWIRHRPRWSAIIFVPVAYLFIRYCVQIADMFILRLSR